VTPTRRTGTNPVLQVAICFLTTFSLYLCPAQSFQASAPMVALQGLHISSKSCDSLLRRSYSNNSDQPPSVSFDHEVKNLLQKTASQTSNSLPNVFQVTSKEECDDIVAGKVDRLTVFRFYATWCRACKRVSSRFDRMARDHPEVNFVNVALTDANKKFITDLGIPSIPYAGIKHPEVGLIEKMKISANWFADFEKIVSDYNEGKCTLPDTNSDGTYRAPYMRAT
jgi:thiol-disulfide isomerase/thioredoxin